MIVGAGTADGAGAVLQYRSEDLDRWEYAGVLSCGRVMVDAVPGSQVWECPQMIQIEDVWVLVVSIQVDGRAGPVVASAGSYDGARFTGGQWHRLVFGTAPYATSVFRDGAGRPCMISWLREDPRQEVFGGWAGAESLVSELAIDSAGRVAATPHPGLRENRLFAHHERPATQWVHDLADFAPARATHLTAPAGRRLEIEIRCAERRPVRVTRSSQHPEFVINRSGRAPDVIPCRNGDTIELFVDADILELYSGGVYGAWRLGSSFRQIRQADRR